MIDFREGTVNEIVRRRKDLTEIKVKLEVDTCIAVNLDSLTGDIAIGDRVVLNTTAVELNLGTGGKHFVLWNFRHHVIKASGAGHIMKLRYTPLQLKLLSVEEQKSPYHKVMQNTDLKGMPVIVGSIHSQLPAVAATIKNIDSSVKIAYVMTDGGALPIVFSDLVYKLKTLNLIDATITAGHAFGGDYEAINVYSSLIAAKYVAKADIAVVIMGPGITGTDTPLGFSGIEQGEIINAVHNLNGQSIAIPRISFSDKRERHYGVSHHTLTCLSKVALASSVVTLPEMSADKMEIVNNQFRQCGVNSKHKIEIMANDETLSSLEKYDLKVTTMGRTSSEEPEFFKAAGCAGLYALRLLKRSGEKIVGS
ncbi:DUF3866 family protein [Candidatus Oleimmundimicrobium sp.]|uniref:DUF3866 family protein n=1 Tax=Candidatus Oleimmundimicrobium sp. TaxID=3060597 RepID=UPI0027159D7E|nr:DUF3866 family protein [Candidatus Oleimmundimicrobium sp.]MDO8886533.1 DUF3866 family protein [Candidatus Oleimmundimicrobium sp.]